MNMHKSVSSLKLTKEDRGVKWIHNRKLRTLEATNGTWPGFTTSEVRTALSNHNPSKAAGLSIYQAYLSIRSIYLSGLSIYQVYLSIRPIYLSGLSIYQVYLSIRSIYLSSLSIYLSGLPIYQVYLRLLSHLGPKAVSFLQQIFNKS